MRAARRPLEKGEIVIIRFISLTLALAVALCCLSACGGPEPPQQSPVADSGPPAPPQPAWWEAAGWDDPASTLEGEGLSAQLYGPDRARITLDTAAGVPDALALYTGEGRVDLLSREGDAWTGAEDIQAKSAGDTLTVMLRDSEIGRAHV